MSRIPFLKSLSDSLLVFRTVYDGEADHDREADKILGILYWGHSSTTFTANPIKVWGMLLRCPDVLQSPSLTFHIIATFLRPSEVMRIVLIYRYATLAIIVPIVNDVGL